MNYSDILDDSRGRAAEDLLATKIIDLMDKLRLEASENAARRWIWELLQNAKDVAYENQPVSVSVELNKDSDKPELKFSHNGKSFTSDNITSLIHQVSSKKRNTEPSSQKKPTGKFGTGFLSTHLLSEKVQVKGIVKEDGLPYKQFSIALDRSAIDPEEVLVAVGKSLEDLALLLNSNDIVSDFDSTKFNTSFSYELEEEKIELAEVGVKDLHTSLPYTMAFSSDIQSVSVSHELINYQTKNRISLDSGIELITVAETDIVSFDSKEHNIVVLSGEKVAIAFGIEKTESTFTVLPYEKNLPKLFCDFPLVGSEHFPFPVIVNSPEFNINEPRNGVWLTHKNDTRVIQNESILEEAVNLYEKALNYASANKWQHLYEIVKTSSAAQNDWLSKSWFDENVLKNLRNIILTTPIIDYHEAKIAINDTNDEPQVFFPFGNSTDVRRGIWNLCKDFKIMPPLSEVDQWEKVMWKTKPQITLPSLARFIEESMTLQTLSANVQRTAEKTIGWLNDFYKIMFLDESFENQVSSDSYAVILSQSDEFKKRSELLYDSENPIQEQVKDALNCLEVNIREKLLSRFIYTGQNIKYFIKTEQNVIDEINTLLTGTSVKSDLKSATSDYITSLFPINDKENERRFKLYAFSKILYSETVPEKKFIHFNADLWKEADKIQVRKIVSTISAEENITNFKNTYKFNDNNQALVFLNDFVGFLVANDMEGLLNITAKPILPNQYGTFKTKDAVNLDDGNISDVLKLVAEKINFNLKEELLDKSIYLQLPEARTITATEAAAKITSKIMTEAATHPRTEEVKEACRLLLLYFIEEPLTARVLFRELYDFKHKLYDDDEISLNMKQAEDVKQLMDELNISTFEEMKDLIAKAMLQNNEQNNEIETNEIKQITEEILASHGISTREEYETFMGSDVTSEIFRHYSVPTFLMLNRANELISRSKNNIIAYLEQRDDYDVEFCDLIAPTVLAGITKKGVGNINIVFRPSDNNEIFFHYPSEKTTLDLDNAELWVDNGLSDPFHLKLGRILLSTGINRIPLHENN
ncbi:hypothetical protein A9970_03715 [Sphingobacterium sp. UME9]|nr:hypothetical protein [Sphingobacterium sp. UME9]